MESNIAKVPSNRLLELDAFRGIAAIMVVLFHYTLRYNQMYPDAPTSPFALTFGHFGVEFFFIISGFVIFLTLNRTKRPLDFIVSRFSRLYPVYWAAVILTFTVVALFGLPGEERSLSQMIFNLTMVHGYVDIPDVDGVYWTLRYELIFYVIMFGLYCIGKLEKVELFCIAWLSLQAASITFDYLGIWFPWKIKFFLILNYCHLFMAGILFYRASQLGFNSTRIALLSTCLAFQFLLSDIYGALFVASCFLLFLGFVNNKLQYLAIKPLIYVGSISYSLYLIHQNIGYIIIRELDHIGIPHLASIGIAIAAAVAFAHLLTYAIERPTLQLIRAKYKKSK